MPERGGYESTIDNMWVKDDCPVLIMGTGKAVGLMSLTMIGELTPLSRSFTTRSRRTLERTSSQRPHRVKAVQNSSASRCTAL